MGNKLDNPIVEKEEDRLKYIVTPGLKLYVEEFIIHCEVANNKPIMIVGPTGVGKSLFLHIFKELYKVKYKGLNNKGEIITVNCAHYSGEMARAELFGYVKGAFTGAMKDKEGLVKDADGGVLILEEIGTLSPETQAMLLTFIEDGEYRKVGDTKVQKCKNVQIVGATNDEGELREDFKNRFSPFHIPPLYLRRADILYLLALKYPGLIESLKPWELLTLLAYNWPGNIRELERVASLFERKRKLGEKNVIHQRRFRGEGFPSTNHAHEEERTRLREDYPLLTDVMDTRVMLGSYLFSAYQDHESLNVLSTLKLYMKLKQHGVPLKILEAILNNSFLGIYPKNYISIFELYSRVVENNIKGTSTARHGLAFQPTTFQPADFKPTTQRDDHLGVNICDPLPIFQEISYGMMFFCAVLFRSYYSPVNILDIDNAKPVMKLFKGLKEDIKVNPGMAKIILSTFNCLSGIKLYEIDEDMFDVSRYKKYYISLFRKNPGNKFLSAMLNKSVKPSKTNADNIYEMKECELQKMYFKGLIERANGNKIDAAINAGMNYSTFKSRLKRLGI